MEYRFQPETDYPEQEAEELSERLLENYQYIHYSNLNQCNYAQFLKYVIKRPSEPSEGSIRRHAMRDEGVTIWKRIGARFNGLFGDGTKQMALDKDKAAAEIEAQRRYSKAISVYKKELIDYYDRLDYYETLLHQGDPDTTCDYFNYVLRSDQFSIDTFSEYEIVSDVFSYNPQTGVLEVSYRIPKDDEIPAISRFVYDMDTDELIGQEFANKTTIKNHKQNLARALLLRAAATIHISDEASTVKTIIMYGYLFLGGTASERPLRKLVIKATFPCDLIEKISPENLEIAKFFKEDIKATEVAGLYVKDPFELGDLPYVAPPKKASDSKPTSKQGNTEKLLI